MPIIEVPNFGQVEFPDSMSDGDIVAAIKKNALNYQSVADKPAAPAPSNMERVAQGLKDPIDGGAQLLTRMLPKGIVDAGNKANNWLADKTGLVGKLPEGGVDQQVQETNDRFKTAGVDWYRMGGNVVSPANLAIASRLPAVGSMASRVASGLAGGSAMGAMTPSTEVDYWGDKAKQIGISATLGGVTPALTGALARVVSPKASVNPDIQLLQKEGVNLTSGQAAGGMMNRIEEKLQSVPFVGDAITSARSGARESFNKAALNRVLAPIGQKAKESGQQGVREAGDLVSSVYDQAANEVKYVKFDPVFDRDFAQLKSMADGLVPQLRNKFHNKIDDIFGGRKSPTGSMLGDTYKKVDSEIGALASQYRGSTAASEKELGDAFAQFQSLMRQQAMRTNPKAADLYSQADEAWANLVRVEGAAKSAKNADGVFTPAQLNMAIQSGDDSVRKRAVSRGTALMQDLGTAGQNVIGNKVPNSGTVDRALTSMGIGGAAFADPLITGSILGAGLLGYTPLAQKMLTGAITKRPDAAQSVAGGVRQAFPFLLPVAPGLLQNYR